MRISLSVLRKFASRSNGSDPEFYNVLKDEDLL